MEANLVMQLKNKAPRVIPVPNEVSVIGRQKNCDFRIPLESISRRHCQVECSEEAVVLRDLGSRNGTILNGTRINDAEQVLEPGDQIKIGPITFIIQIDGQPDSNSLETSQAAPEEASPAAPEDASSDTFMAVGEDGLDSDDGLEGALEDADDLDILDLDELDDLDDLDDLELDDI